MRYKYFTASAKRGRKQGKYVIRSSAKDPKAVIKGQLTKRFPGSKLTSWNKVTKSYATDVAKKSGCKPTGTGKTRLIKLKKGC